MLTVHYHACNWHADINLHSDVIGSVYDTVFAPEQAPL